MLSKVLLSLGLIVFASGAWLAQPAAGADSARVSVGTQRPSVHPLSTGVDNGGGGDGVVVGNSVSLLDLVEDFPEYFAPTQGSYYPLVEKKIYTLYQKLSPMVAPEIAGLVWIKTHKRLEEIPDEGTVAYYGPGNKQQLAVQKDDVVVVQADLFAKMTDEHKAALIVHEVLVRGAMRQVRHLQPGFSTQPVRKIVAALFSPAGETIPPSYYQGFWTQLPTPSKYVFQGVEHNVIVNFGVDGYANLSTVTFNNPSLPHDGVRFPLVFRWQWTTLSDFQTLEFEAVRKVCGALGLTETEKRGPAAFNEITLSGANPNAVAAIVGVAPSPVFWKPTGTRDYQVWRLSCTLSKSVDLDLRPLQRLK